MAAATTAKGVEVYRQRRNAVKERHAAELSASSAAAASTSSSSVGRRARAHPRWKELCNDDDQDSDAPARSTAPSTQPESLFGPAYIPSESTVRNDYSQHFVDTQSRELPGNAVRNPHKATRFAEYPKLRRLIEAKNSVLRSISHPSTFLQADLRSSIGSHSGAQTAPSPSLTLPAFKLTDLLPIKYDVIVVDPPLEAYEWESVPSSGVEASKVWSWNDVAALPIPQIAAKESFVFLWVGSGASDGLERGREVLMRWGYRRCEDIVWIRTAPPDDAEAASSTQMQTGSTFVRTVEHCLMGIRGTVRRSTDSRFVHCNIDTDVILWPGEAVGEDERERSADGSTTTQLTDSRSKPPEMMDLIENFCLGTRRLELFGRNRNLRRGWLTVGLDVGPDKAGWTRASHRRNPCAASDIAQGSVVDTPIAYEKQRYDAQFGVDRAGCSLAERVNLVPYHEEIDALRPKSPTKMSASGHDHAAGRDHRRESSNNVGAPQWAASPMAHPTGGHIGQAEPSRMNPYAVYHPNAAHHSRPPLAHVGSGAGNSPSPSSGGGGAGLSGLGAGGRSVVSVPSGSELLSGAQANVLLNQQQQQQQQGGQWHSTNGVAGGGGAGQAAPSGLSRRGSRRR